MLSETIEMLDNWWEELGHDAPLTISIGASDVADVRMLVADRDDRITELLAENKELQAENERLEGDRVYCSVNHGDGPIYEGVAELERLRAENERLRDGAVAEGQGED